MGALTASALARVYYDSLGQSLQRGPEKAPETESFLLYVGCNRKLSFIASFWHSTNLIIKALRVQYVYENALISAFPLVSDDGNAVLAQ